MGKLEGNVVRLRPLLAEHDSLATKNEVLQNTRKVKGKDDYNEA